VLICERRDIPGAWQFPQGGIEEGEEPEEAMFREVEEETKIPKESLRLLCRYPEPLVYELPRKAQSVKTGMGQVQFWFLLKLKKRPRTPERPLPGSEFSNFSWVPIEEAISRVVGFKKAVYRKIANYFQGSISGVQPPAHATSQTRPR
jgi:putative (di)nucleoside polyphosphate hydrolase